MGNRRKVFINTSITPWAKKKHAGVLVSLFPADFSSGCRLIPPRGETFS